MMRLWLVVTFALVSASVLGISASLADPCAALRSQLAPSGRSGGISSELAQLRRQLAAIQGLERQRRCTAQSAVGGFFNACADLAKSRTQVQRQIADAAISRRDASGLQARLVALGCRPAAGQQRQRPAGAMIGSNSMLFCVRLSDGYFFPAPKSQFVQGGDVKEMVDQCRYSATMPASTCTCSVTQALKPKRWSRSIRAHPTRTCRRPSNIAMMRTSGPATSSAITDALPS